MNYIPFPEYDELSPEDKARICNGCGPGGWKIDVIPDNLLGASIREACDRHDMAYHLGRDKDEADRDFIANMVTEIIMHERQERGLVAKCADKAILKARLNLAVDFFLAVHLAGGSFFGNGDE